MPSISVVIPAKDDAEMLERCLTALARQTRQPDEVIVIDNASSDASPAVARRHGATVIEETRPGITAAASRGYDAARGEIIARCDADSVVPPTWLAQIEERMAARPDVVAVTGPASFYDLSPVAGWFARVFYLDAYFLAVGAAVANPPLFGSNFAIRRETWAAVSDSVPRDNPDLHDDFDLSYRIPPECRVLLDRRLIVGISGRPFRDARAFGTRLRRGWVTMREHLPAQLPPVRWLRRWRGRADTNAHPAPAVDSLSEQTAPRRQDG
jgi:glycosyltransferase involved in cell wall biosynthesis